MRLCHCELEGNGGRRHGRRLPSRFKRFSLPSSVGAVIQLQKGFRLRLHVSGDVSYRAALLTGDPGIEQTVRIMRRLVDGAVSDPSFVRFASDIVRNVPQYDEAGEVFALFSWVQGHIRYTKDPVTKEKLYPPQELLKIRAGDCDDTAMLLGALAIAIGYPARLVTVAANPDYPEDFSHVYTEVECPAGSGSWIAVDAARPGSAFGLEPKVYFRKKAWSLTDDTSEMLGRTRLRGLAGYMRGLGQDESSQVTSQVLTELPVLIAATQGQQGSFDLSRGTVSVNSPYASFMTPYTPGYAVPAAGYGAFGGALPQISGNLFSSALPWILAGVVALAVFKR